MSAKPTVFISDPSVEAERITQALRTAELHVVDVPLSMLVARVAVQRPDVVIVDADAEGALDAVARMRELPDAESIDVLFCGRPGAALAGAEDALAHEGSGFFARPIQVPALIKKVESLAGAAPPSEKPPAPAASHSGPSSRPPSVGPSSRPPSRPPGSLRPPMSQRVPPPTSIVSHELAALLSRAEDNVEQAPASDQIVPSPEEEINAVLPEEVLAALDAPLEGDDEEDEVGGPSRVTTSSGRAQPTTGVRAPSAPPEPLTHDGSAVAHQTQGEMEPRTSDGATQARSAARPRSEPPPPTPPRRASSVPPPTHLQPPSVLSSTLGSELLVQQGGMIGAVPLAPFGQPSSMPVSPAPSTYEDQAPREMSMRAVSVPRPNGPFPLASDEAPRILANAIAERQTGALTFDAPTGVRRVVLREGDVVTAASGVDAESLLFFLGARGDLTRERVESLSGRLPPYGRHAGAALVAQGALGQEQLWPVLRAHAEHIMAQVLAVPSGTWLLEPDPPGRLKTEPSVFGGVPGAAILVEVVRRVISSSEAMRRCGGKASVIGEGPRAQLLRECGLAPQEVEAIRLARGERLETLVAQAPDGDLPSVVYALWLLGVVEMVRSAFERAVSSDGRGPTDTLDEDAIRDRIQARLALVDEGDYFALLGVPHNATAYEVRRAYLDLRRAFDPSRVLTPGLVDLAEDVRRITGVLEEAYEILGDNARRERYRRAIDQAP